MFRKKGQEEIVGFVAVVVLLSVIALVLLSFSFRSDENVKESSDVSYFLDSMMEYTSDCSMFFVNENAKVGELFMACYRGDSCEDGTLSCNVLNETLGLMIEKSLRFGEERPIKGYTLTGRAYNNLSRSLENDEFFKMEGGNCTSYVYAKKGASEFRPSRSDIIEIELELCS